MEPLTSQLQLRFLESVRTDASWGGLDDVLGGSPRINMLPGVAAHRQRLSTGGTRDEYLTQYVPSSRSGSEALAVVFTLADVLRETAATPEHVDSPLTSMDLTLSQALRRGRSAFSRLSGRIMHCHQTRHIAPPTDVAVCMLRLRELCVVTLPFRARCTNALRSSMLLRHIRPSATALQPQAWRDHRSAAARVPTSSDEVPGSGAMRAPAAGSVHNRFSIQIHSHAPKATSGLRT